MPQMFRAEAQYTGLEDFMFLSVQLFISLIRSHRFIALGTNPKMNLLKLSGSRVLHWVVLRVGYVGKPGGRTGDRWAMLFKSTR